MSARLFVDRDGYGDLCVWENLPGRPSAPRVVLSKFHVEDDVLWDAIVRLVESGGAA